MTGAIQNLAGLVEMPAMALRPGMYIAELDRPWLETPFALQGFMVQDDDDVEYVAKHCNVVFVDPRRNASGQVLPKGFRDQKDPVSIKSELQRAKVDFQTATHAIESVFTQLQNGAGLNVEALQSAVNPLIDSVFRNRDAMAALIRMKDKGDYLFNHAVANAVWCAVLGRHLGLDKSELQQLALGASMMDVGMTRIPDDILSKPGPLDSHERKVIENHVRQGLKLIQKAGGASMPVMNMIACHHERFDGSGYPQGLKGKKIPKIARIGALVDCYDAMITPRPHAPARSSFAAIQELMELRDIHHQGPLIEQFVQTIGMFPTGSLIELNTGEVGIVIAQNPQRRLRPKLVVVLDPNKKRLPKMQHRDLDDPAICGRGVPTQWITQELQAGKYGLKADEYFL